MVSVRSNKQNLLSEIWKLWDVVGTKKLSACCGTPVLNIEADSISLSHENSASFATKPLQFPVVTKMDVIRHLSLKYRRSIYI